jgi:putative membrane protein
MFYQHNMGAGGWVFMVLGNIVIWGLIIAFVLGLVQHLRSRTHRHHIASGASASEILDRRFASGEIDADKYQRLRTTLAQTPNETRPGSESAAGALT